MTIRILILVAAVAGTWYATKTQTEKRLTTEWRLAIGNCVGGHSDIFGLEQCVIRVSSPLAAASTGSGQ